MLACLLVGLLTTTPRAIIKNPTQIPNLDQKVDYERIYEQHTLGHFYTEQGTEQKYADTNADFFSNTKTIQMVVSTNKMQSKRTKIFLSDQGCCGVVASFIIILLRGCLWIF